MHLRVLLLSFFIVNSFQSVSHAVTLGGLEIGALNLNLQLDITDPRGAVSSNGFVHVAGNSGGVGVRQIIDLANGTISQAETFLDTVAAGSNGVGPNEAFISGVGKLADGTVVYLGAGDTGNGLSSPIYWLDVSSPVAASLPGNGGAALTISSSGIVGGLLSDIAVVGTLASALQFIPGATTPSGVVGLNDDGSYAVGTSIWKADAQGGFAEVDLSNWDTPTDAFGIPDLFFAALQVDAQTLFVGEYVDANLFTTRVGIWDEDGSFLGGTAAGSTYAAVGIFEGEVILGVNSELGGALYALSNLSSSVLLSDLLGAPATIVKNSFFVGSLGLVAQGPGGNFLSTTFQTSPAGGTEVPEPTAMALFSLGGLLIPPLRKRQRGIVKS